MKNAFVEGVLIALVGVTVGFAANALSPRGLKLSRNYFPGGTSPRPAGAVTNSTVSAQANGTSLSAAEAHLREKGLQVVSGAQAEALFHDPRTEQELVVFVDARSTQHYEEGHIPGAVQFDHYHPEMYAGAVIPACQKAQQIIVYCKGGDCEDSEFAALMLRDSMGIPNEKLFVYTGGITDWEGNNRPVETGARKSGQIRTKK